MKRLTAVAGGAAFVFHRLAAKLRAMRAHCHGITVTGGVTPI
jgi:hypothetical protein